MLNLLAISYHGVVFVFTFNMTESRGHLDAHGKHRDPTGGATAVACKQPQRIIVLNLINIRDVMTVVTTCSCCYNFLGDVSDKDPHDVPVCGE